MTAERDKCGLSSLLPISCRDRAEAFARNLQSRLHSLGSQNSTSEDRSWLGSHDSNNIALSQPLHNPDTERYLALDMLESPCSPQDEIEESELRKLLNNKEVGNSCLCPIKVNSSSGIKLNGLTRHYSGDSDNEVFYDIDDDPPNNQPYANGMSHSTSSKSIESETEIDVNSQGTGSDIFATSQDCTPQQSVSDEMSTVSLRDDSSNSICEECENDKKLETEISDNNEEYVNGEESNENEINEDIYISRLTIQTELVVECAINEDKKENESRIISNNDIEADDDDDDNDDDYIPRVRRCSSLKTGKTPPGTPGRKKIVRFADVLGLDLADVRTFLDEIPKVPKSAYTDLSDVDLSESSSDLSNITNGLKFHGLKIERFLLPLFEQPAGSPNFLDKVRDNQVCLENALVEDPILFKIKGTVRVKNLDFNKSVHIRYTLDSWKTFADVQAIYVNNSCDGFSDRFSFTIYAHTLSVGQKIELACRFQCKGCQYWDNNGGKNYVFQCLPGATNNTATPVVISHGHADWGASFY
ncbi:unnamed protein product [Ceutorhynchus assimilis]|uniref:CBM21 domain-containing protein n=1 Tax=Ceutorhynchus assimilis TaxID=467358 RepID=A0A9P0DMQ9_9CUCU|nr:unnamed protein product [Ceutorhynchus assimilis]